MSSTVDVKIIHDPIKTRVSVQELLLKAKRKSPVKTHVFKAS